MILRQSASAADVSVIIPAYNAERYIERAMRSALQQEGVCVELVVVDDCSTDATWRIISSMDDPRVQCVKLQENSGPSVARNTGIAHASGQWIAVLDADDAFEPGRLLRCIRHAQSQGADIVVDNITICREEDGAVFPMFSSAQISRMKRLSLADFIAGNASFFNAQYDLGYLKPVFSASFLRDKSLSYHTGIRIGEDYMLLAEALASGAVCAVEQMPGYIYTVRKDSLSHTMSLEDIKCMTDGNARFVKLYALDPQSQAAQRKRDASLHEIYYFMLLVNAIKQKNIRNIKEVMKRHPAAVRHLWRPLWVRVKRAAMFLKDLSRGYSHHRQAYKV